MFLTSILGLGETGVRRARLLDGAAAALAALLLLPVESLNTFVNKVFIFEEVRWVIAAILLLGALNRILGLGRTY